MERLNVSIENDKYRIIQYEAGHVAVFRNGENWRDVTGDKLILALAQEVEALREKYDTLYVDYLNALPSAEG